MKKILTIAFIFLTSLCFGQSETNDFITYDTTFTSGTHIWQIRISRPANMFTAGHPDTASRPAIITIPGLGEIGTNPAKLQLYGPHYWLNNGWDGGVTLANGTHYPILITMVPNVANVRPGPVLLVMQHLLSTYKIKANSVHVAGLSMGGFTWGRFICFSPAANDFTPMSMIKSFVSLQGIANDLSIGYNLPGWAPFGYWAANYGGRFFGLEGTADGRGVYNAANNIRDTAAARSIANNAYFSMEDIGGGGHCCWNSMYDPNQKDWLCYPTASVTYSGIGFNGSAGKDNRMGNYVKGWSVFEWMLRQGDTTLVGSGAGSVPVTNAGPDQTITATSATLNGSATTGATSYAWSWISGPNTPTLANGTSATATIGVTGTALLNGIYVYRLTATNSNGSASDDVQITKNAPSNVLPVANAGADRSIIFPADSVHLNGSGTDADGTISTYAWTKTSGGLATITPTNAATTVVTGLEPGIYIFRLTVMDNDGGTHFDEVTITVVDQSTGTAKRVNVNIHGGTAYSNAAWNNLNITTTTSITNMVYEDGTSSGYNFSITGTTVVADNGSSWGGTMCPTEVLRFASYLTTNRTVTLTNLDNEKQYNLFFYSSRNNTGNSTAFTIGGNTVTVLSSGNLTNSATFTNVTPVNGVITVTIARVNTYNYINGFTLEEVGAASTNQPPVVTITGGNQAITLPTSSTTVTGSVTDEGGALTYLWTKVSGPAGGVISSPTSLSTGITTLQQGVYIYQLAITDTGSLTGTANVQITVNSASNTLPVADADADQTITAPTSQVTLSGAGSDADGTIASHVWSFISRPIGTGIITDPTSYTSTVTGLVEGSYVLELIVTDNSGDSDRDTMQITVNPSPSELVDNLPKVIVGPGEYQVGFIDSARNIWGLGNLSNIGVNNTGTVGVPKRWQGDALTTKFKSVIGALHGLYAIDTSGNVWSTGDNDHGQHGMGDLTHPYYLPRKIMTDSAGNSFTNVKQLAAFFVENKHNGAFAVKEDGTLWVWGRPLGGMRGNGTNATTADSFALSPVQIVMPNGKQVQQIIGGNFAIALCTDGTVYTWGPASNNNLGYTATGNDSWYPHQLTTLSGITQIAGGANFNYALRGDGVLFGWGAYGDHLGRTLGNPISVPTQLTEIMAVLPASIKELSTNFNCTHALLSDSTLWGWGETGQGTIGNGLKTNMGLTGTNPFDRQTWTVVKTPVNILPTKKIVFITPTTNVFSMYKYALDSAGQLYCWGRGKSAVLADQLRPASSSIAATWGGSWDVEWPTPVSPFTISTSYISSSDMCLFYPDTTSCSSYTMPANTAPVANAGVNDTITVRNVTLDGTGSDDDVYIPYYRWKQISGPSSAIINVPASKTPTVSNMNDGVYQFELTTTDNGWLVDKDTVTITVNATTNAVPIVNAGPDQVITLPTTQASLSSTGGDSDGSIVSYAWVKFSGVGGTITTPAASSTTVTALSAGVYEFDVTVTDNNGATATDRVKVTVLNVEPPTRNWKRKYNRPKKNN